MSDSIKPVLRLSLTSPKPAPLFTLVCLLGYCLIAQAHGPGLDDADRITAKLLEVGEQPALFARRALVFQNNHMWSEAMSDFDKAAELDAENVEYDLDRANLSYQAGNYLRALDFIDLYRLRSDISTESALIQARSYRALGQQQESIAAYRTALAQLDQFDGRPLVEWYMEFANILLLTGDRGQARGVLLQGIDRLGALSVFQLKAAELEVDLGLYDSALARIEQILGQSQRKDLWLARRADILASAGREAEAQQGYRQALAALEGLPLRLRNLPVSSELAEKLKKRISKP